jgi:hypothetical protein
MHIAAPSRFTRAVRPILMLTLGLLIGLVAPAVFHHHHAPARAASVSTVETPAPPISWLCVDGHTFLRLGGDGLAEFPARDSMCAASPAK